MSYAEEIMQSLLLVLEAPGAQKGYREMEKCYEKHGKTLEVDSIQHLMKVKFGKPEDSNLSE